MSDQSGVETGIVTNTPITKPTIDETMTMGIHYLKDKAATDSSLLETTYLKSLAANMRTVGKRYGNDVLSFFTDGKKPSETDYPQLEKNLADWFKGDHPSCFNKIPKTAELFKDNLPHNFSRLNPLYGNLNHDAVLAITPVMEALKKEPGYEHYLSTPVLEWPQHVIERVARQVEKSPIIESFDPRTVNSYLGDLFKQLTDDGNFQLEFTIDPNITTLQADRTFFEGALFNLIRNAQNQLAKREDKNSLALVNVSLTLVDGKAVLQVRDNGGGFKENMLRPPTDEAGNPLKDKKGNAITYPSAFVRTVTEGGSGLGLDIVREITEDHLKGKVNAFNDTFPGTEQLGAVVEMSFPYKN